MRTRPAIIKFGITLVLGALLCALSSVAYASDESDVRSVVQQVFQQLKSRDYGSSMIRCRRQLAAACRGINSSTR